MRTRTGPAPLRIAGAAAVLLALALLAQFSSPNIPDLDTLYHLGHAAVYRERGPLFAEFPWLAFSQIGRTGADLWYGFHLLLLPFTLLRDGILAAKLAGVAATFTALALFAWSLRRLGARPALLWTLLLAASSADVLYRLTMARPHGITMGLTVAAFSLAVRGSPAALCAACALAAFAHLALGWLPPLAVALVAAVRAGRTGALDPARPAAAAAGALLGALARPNPWGALELAWTQVVDLLVLKSSGLPVSFGRELLPPNAGQIVRQVLPPALILAAAAVLLLRTARRPRGSEPRDEDLRVAAWASGLLGVLFGAISVFVARRGLDLFAAFAVTAAAASVSLGPAPHEPGRKPPLPARASAAGLAALLLLGANAVPTFARYMRQAWAPDHLREAALWLQRSSRPGEIVFHTRWDHFGPLFFWNRGSRYLSGMDPVFQYRFSPELYWKWHWIAADKGERRTCGQPRCRWEDAEATELVLARDFGAAWLLLDRSENRRLFARLEQDRIFPKLFDDGRHAIYRVAPPR